LQYIAHHVADDFGQALGQIVHLAFQAIESAFQAIEPLVMAIKTGFYGRKVVAIATGLFEDVAGDHLLALHFALDRVHASLEMIEFVPRYIGSHGLRVSQSLDLKLIAQVVSLSSRA